MTTEIEHFSYRHALLNMSYVLEVSVRILRKENKKLLYYRLHDYSKVDICSFSVERKSIEFVDFFTHLGHVISSDLDDCRDVANRRQKHTTHYRTLRSVILSILLGIRWQMKYAASGREEDVYGKLFIGQTNSVL